MARANGIALFSLADQLPILAQIGTIGFHSYDAAGVGSL